MYHINEESYECEQVDEKWSQTLRDGFSSHFILLKLFRKINKFSLNKKNCDHFSSHFKKAGKGRFFVHFKIRMGRKMVPFEQSLVYTTIFQTA